jgi:Domain of unknown function (DUF4287)/Domain of unknown function (DUF5655)
MSFQAYLDNIKAKTGKTPDDFRVLAQEKGLSKHGEIVAWLKADFALGHGHAQAIAHLLLGPNAFAVSSDDRLAKLFTGSKAVWRGTYDAIEAQILCFGPDAGVASTSTYVSLLRGKKKFAVVQPSSAERLDIGIKLRGVPVTERLEAAGSWNSMVTHRVRVTDASQLDAELLGWLRQAYDLA